MRTISSLLALTALSLPLLLTPGCGGDDGSDGGSSGGEGAAASGGSGGAAAGFAGGSGQSGKGGAAGAAGGSGGQAGSAGNQQGPGGQGGSSGNQGGSAGSGGAAAGAGGVGAGAGGEGGEAGSGGSGAAGAGGSAGGGGSGEAGSGTGGSAGGGLPSTTAKLVSVGRLHSCAVTAEGGVRCWGEADRAQLGNGVMGTGSSSAAPVPVAVTGLSSGVTAISSFGDHTCVVASGAAKCWGGNEAGQLGDGSTSDSPVPVGVVGLESGVTAVTAGELHACALTASGAVHCWGKNDFGQLGDGSDSPNAPTPVAVSGLGSDVKAIAAGRYHTCAVTSGGAVKCWGGNLYGELGIGTTGPGEHAPVDVTGLGSGAEGISAGDSVTCTIASGGALRCWGKNGDGQLGNGKSGFNVDEAAPVDVTGVSSGATSISAGYGFTCAVVSGAARCWGSNQFYTLGNGQDASFTSAVAVDVTGLGSGALAVAASSSDHACAVTTAGAVVCWGNAGAHLGSGDVDTNAPSPVPVAGLP